MCVTASAAILRALTMLVLALIIHLAILPTARADTSAGTWQQVVPETTDIDINLLQQDDDGYDDGYDDDIDGYGSNVGAGNATVARTSDSGNIPSVNERVPDPQAGPRLIVNKFSLKNFKSYPELGITKASVLGLIEGMRVSYQRKDVEIAHGYTQEDLLEIAQYLAEIDARNGGAMATETDMQILLDIVRSQPAKRGITYGQIEEVTEALTNFYREKGFFLAKAYVPAQEVDSGEVALAVLEGKLAGVQVANNDYYSEEVIRDAFSPLLNTSVTQQKIEQSLYILNDYPGLDIYGTFSAGDSVGETTLNLNVRDEKSWSATLRLDNHGSEFTGERRDFAIVEWLNVTGHADKLNVGLLRSESPSNSTYGFVNYEVPVINKRTSLAIQASTSDYVIGGSSNDAGSQGAVGGLKLSGDNEIYEVGLNYAFWRGRETNLVAGVSVTDKQSELVTDVAEFQATLNQKQHVKGAGLKVKYDKLFERQRILAQLNAHLSWGEIDEGVLDGQDREFYKLSFNSSSLFFIPLPLLDVNNRMVLRANGQYSESALPSLEQFSLGGANAVKAFNSSDFSGDTGLYLGLDWFVEVPGVTDFSLWNGRGINEFLQLVLFGETAYGVRHTLDNTADLWSMYSGVGLGLEFNWNQRFSGRLNISHPITNKASETASQALPDDIQIFVDMSYQFN